jgi:hypothetical protein
MQLLVSSAQGTNGAGSGAPGLSRWEVTRICNSGFAECHERNGLRNA